MSNYVVTTNFGAKDALAPGNPSKIIKGSEFTTEFAAIATAIATKADLASPALTGTPTAPTAAVDTNTTQLATTAFVIGQGYLKAATAAATYAATASPTFTGTPAAPTAAADTNTTQLATTAFVIGQGYLKSATAAATYAPLASPTLTGVPAAPTAAADTNTTQLATTAYVVGQGYLKSATAAATYQTQAGMASYLTTANAAATYAPLASPTFTGTPAAPNAAADTNTTQIATTSFVVNQGYLKSATAAATYQTQAGMSSYLTTASASSTYQTQAGMSSYLTTASAASTYAALNSSPTFTGLVKGRGGGAGLGQITVSTLAPSGGAAGDLWFKY